MVSSAAVAGLGLLAAGSSGGGAYLPLYGNSTSPRLGGTTIALLTVNASIGILLTMFYQLLPWIEDYLESRTGRDVLRDAQLGEDPLQVLVRPSWVALQVGLGLYGVGREEPRDRAAGRLSVKHVGVGVPLGSQHGRYRIPKYKGCK